MSLQIESVYQAVMGKKSQTKADFCETGKPQA